MAFPAVDPGSDHGSGPRCSGIGLPHLPVVTWPEVAQAHESEDRWQATARSSCSGLSWSCSRQCWHSLNAQRFPAYLIKLIDTGELPARLVGRHRRIRFGDLIDYKRCLTTDNLPATEMNTTLGVAGPVSGVSATGFNGKSSWIPLDGAWCTTSGSMSSCYDVGGSGQVLGGSTSEAFSIWFKATAAGGVLLSEDPDLPGTKPDEFSAFAYGSLLYVTSSGDLGSQLCTYGAANWVFDCGTMTSKTTVDNGAWHQAVVIPGQALYLDGTEVATTKAGWPGEGDGDVEAQGPVAYAVAGTGLVPNNCTETCTANTTWSYFNGSMADLSIYQDQLPSAGTIAAQYTASATAGCGT